MLIFRGLIDVFFCFFFGGGGGGFSGCDCFEILVRRMQMLKDFGDVQVKN